LTPPLVLQTLGGLTLTALGQNITGAATQRRRLGLLVALAAAGERGMPRDKVQALLWPESPGERARHALAQLLYAQRLDLGMADLFLGTKTLRLNAELIATDLADFQRALDSDDLPAAFRIYRGPFLDGFHLGGGLEFENWQGAERERLERQYADLLERLAARVAAEGDRPRAAEWWRRRLALDPANSRVAAALVSALSESGDRVGALRAGVEHEHLLRQELGIVPDDGFLELLARLRGG
jgi:DNA-binding SARP family transcriptional activator